MNMGTEPRLIRPHPWRFLGAMTVVFVGVVLYFEWGFWRSTSYILFGVEVPLRKVYRTEFLSEGNVPSGLCAVVYELPGNMNHVLDEHGIDLRNFPSFDAGFERDGYTRTTWVRVSPEAKLPDARGLSGELGSGL